MKVKARFVKKGFNPFTPLITAHIRALEKNVYTKTVDVPDDTDMKWLETMAKNDATEGFEFVKLEII